MLRISWTERLKPTHGFGRKLVYQKKKTSDSKLSIGDSVSTATGIEEVAAWFWLQLMVK